MISAQTLVLRALSAVSVVTTQPIEGAGHVSARAIPSRERTSSYCRTCRLLPIATTRRGSGAGR